MKNTFTSITNKMISRYKSKDDREHLSKSTNINILLNRVKLDQKKEFKKKLIFTFFITSIVGTFLFFAMF